MIAIADMFVVIRLQSANLSEALCIAPQLARIPNFLQSNFILTPLTACTCDLLHGSGVGAIM